MYIQRFIFLLPFFLSFSFVNRETYLKYQGDIVSPKDMHTALIKYPVTNTTYILANTTHAPFKRKFDVPKLSVRSVHEYVYGADGNVELYHHTSLKKIGTHEKLWFHPPPSLTPNATAAEAKIHKAATTGHEKILAWSATTAPNASLRSFRPSPLPPPFFASPPPPRKVC